MAITVRRAGPVTPVDHIWLVAGQSNASGAGVPIDTTNYDVSDPRVWVYNTNGTLTGTVSLARDPIPQHNHAVPPGIGPGLGFARRLIRTLDGNDRIVLVGVAHGGVGMRTSEGDDYCWKVDGFEDLTSLFPNLVERAQAALAACGDGARIAGVLWVQGESENFNTANYEADLDELIDAIRDSLDEPALPFVIGQMVPDYITGDRVTIDAIHKDTPRRKTRAAFAYGPTPGYVLPDGSSHYNSAGQRILADRMADAVAHALTNVTGTDPETVENVTITQDGTDLLVGWDQPDGRVTDYTVQWRAGTSGAWTTLVRAQSIDAAAVITGITKGNTYQAQVATINEEGTSGYSTPVTIVTVTDPAAGTGLAAGTPESTRMPLTWNTAARAAGYLVEYKKTSDSEWVEFDTVTTTGATVTGLAFSTSHDFRVTPVNAAGSGTVSSTVTTDTAELGFLVTDVGVSAARAYSPARKLVSGYAGSAIRVRRSSDDTEYDIGFSDDVLDTAALLTAVGPDNGYLTKIYDQSGNGLDLAQTSRTLQPRIVNAGVIDMRSGFPVGIWDGIDDYMSNGTAGAFAAGAASSLFVGAGAAAAAAVIWRESTTVVSGALYGIHTDGSGRVSTRMVADDSATTPLSNHHGLTTFTGDPVQMSWVDTGTSVDAWTNGTQGTARSYTRSGVFSVVNFAVGATLRSVISGWMNMALNELVVWHSALSDPERQAGEANQKAFYGTP